MKQRATQVYCSWLFGSVSGNSSSSYWESCTLSSELVGPTVLSLYSTHILGFYFLYFPVRSLRPHSKNFQWALQECSIMRLASIYVIGSKACWKTSMILKRRRKNLELSCIKILPWGNFRRIQCANFHIKSIFQLQM